MKKSKIIGVVILVVLVVALAAGLIWSQMQLYTLSFKEGMVVDNANADGGIVTVSEDWIVYKDDSFIKENASSEYTVEDIYCDLHKEGLMISSEGVLAKVTFTKEVEVREADIEKTYYLVGDYYIASPVTTISSVSEG